MSVIDEIKQKIDIVDLLSGYLKLQKSGRNYRALCPFHAEKAPSFFVFPEQQRWHCFGACGIGGDIFSFIMKKEGLDFSQSLRQLADKAGITIDTPEIKSKEQEKSREILLSINAGAATYFHQLLLSSKIAEIARKYISSRGISSEIVEDFQLGYCKPDFEDLGQYLLKKGFSQQDLLLTGLIIKSEDDRIHDRFRNRLIFPICDIQGNVIGFGARSLDDTLPKYLNSPQSPVFDKSDCLYAIDKAKAAIRKNNNVIIVEGYMDVLTSHQFGWQNTIATMGTALTNRHITTIRKLTKNLVLALDSDIAGEEATFRIAESIQVENLIDTDINVVITSQGKDPDEEIRTSPDIWKKDLENKKQLIDFIMELIETKYNLNSVDEKNMVIDKTLPIFNKINDPVRRGEYIRKFARIIMVKDADLEDILKKKKMDETRHKKYKDVMGIKPSDRSILFATNKREESCLKMLLQCPELRDEGMKIPSQYFENSVILEIYLKWRENNDINYLKSILDPAIHNYLNSLINEIYLPFDRDNYDRKLKALQDCIDRLHEQYIRAQEARKGIFFSFNTKNDIESGELPEIDISGSQQLTDILIRRKQRKQTVS